LELTQGTLLGGRLRYAQPRTGFRTGIEPVLLAASIPAGPGERVLEGGTGAGAALLCLLARVPEAWATGIEADAAMAAVAAANLRENGMARGTVEHADVLTAAGAAPFDHAMANPPWHDPGGTMSPDARRAMAKRASTGLLAAWTAALARQLRVGGTLTLVLPAASLGEGMAAMRAAGCGRVSLLPLWPRADTPARLLLLQGVRGAGVSSQILPGLILHEGAGYSAKAHAILWEGDDLALG
jgi:tRNA1(Val) A37 N6-methylase TrmN6